MITSFLGTAVAAPFLAPVWAAASIIYRFQIFLFQIFLRLDREAA
jgi:hypothetical protein